MINNVPRYSLCKNSAINTLLQQNIKSYIIDIREFNFTNIAFCSFQDFAKTNNLSVDDLCPADYMKDGYTVHFNDRYLILYNKYLCIQRIRFTLAHELGHIILKHRSDDVVEEYEANLFASHLLMPDAVIEQISRQFAFTSFSIRDLFGVSYEAAQIKYDYITNKINRQIFDTDAKSFKLICKYKNVIAIKPNSQRYISRYNVSVN